MRTLLLFLAVTLSLAPALPPDSEPPNILLIVTDDLGTFDLGCYGNTLIETPRLDALAANGRKFTRAYAASPVCSPSRAAIQTGLHPARMALTEHIHGFPPPDPCWPLEPPNSMQRLPFAYTTTAEVLRDAGYATAYVGKWHLGGFNHIPSGHGFDVSYAAGPQGLPASFFPPYFNNPNLYPELNTIAGDDDYLADALTTLAIETLPQGANGSPFFLNLNYYAPHVPIEGPPDLVAKYEALIPADDPTEPEYAAMIEAIDRQVGRLVDTLAARGLLDQTLILFTSDHGALTVEEPGFPNSPPVASNGPLRGGKGSVYEGGIRVPLLAHGPGVATGEDDFITSNVDFLPTLTAVAEAPTETLDGAEIPALTGGTVTDRNLYWHYPDYSNQGGTPAGVVRNDTYKLIDWYSDVDSVYLFNLIDDPGETLNLAADLPDVVAQLQGELDAWKVFTGAREMTPNPIYNPDDCN